MEIWKDIKGYEGKYQVSNLGRIKSLRDAHGNYREKILSNRIRGRKGSEYYAVALYKNNKPRNVSVHRLVAEAFVPKKLGKNDIDHINTNRFDNRAENLRWATNRENQNNVLTKIHHSESMMSEKNHRSKSVYCLELNKIYGSASEAGRELNISQTGISACCRGEYETIKGHHFKYVELLHCYN